MKKINFLIFILVSPFCILQAQTVDDALRYSQLNVYGTSRFSAMSGAFGALGGDFGASSTNPAGLAIFRSSEFTVTPSVFGKNTSTTFLNQVRDDNNINLNFSNIGFVGANVFEQPTNGWMSTAFSVGYNRTNNFDSNVLIAGENQNSSLLDVFVSQANARGGLTPERLDPFGALLAYQANLIFDADTAPNNFRYESDIPNAGPAGINQRKSIVTSGGMGELLFSYAGNYDDRLYLGGTIGYSSIRYNYFSRHHEEALPDTNHILDSFTYTDEFKTSGGGVNLKIGVLYRVFDWLRLGGAVHTPTFYNLTDTYGNSMTSNFKSGFTFYDTTVSATGSFNYRLTTPMRAIGSVAFVIARQGLISADYEFVDYSASRFSATNTDFSNVNTATRESLTSAGNIRLGAEWRFDPFAIRAGYSNQGNPYRGGFNNGSINSYSVGFGIREEAFFLDFAYILTQVRDQRLFIYDPAFVSPANVNTNTNTIMATFGMRF